MDDYEYSYSGMENGESYPSDTEISKSDESTTESDNDENAFISTALTTSDSYRLSEIDPGSYDLTDRLKVSSASKSGSDILPSVAFVNDRRRVSLHPLGIIKKPGGVSKSFWERMDEDRLFPNNYDLQIELIDETVVKGKEKQELVKSEHKTSSGGSGGDKTTDEVEGKNDPSEMPFLDHLEEFRWSLLKSIFIIGICMIASWFLSDRFYGTITRLAKAAELELISTKLMEGIMMKLQMTLVMGLVIALPFAFYFLWSFVSPGLYKKEKKWILPLVFVATVCFFIGASIAYFIIIPFILPFIKAFMPDDVRQMITIGDFVSKMLKFTLLFGIIFELPLVSYFLAKLGILKHTFMTRYRRYAIVSIFIIRAIITKLFLFRQNVRREYLFHKEVSEVLPS